MSSLIEGNRERYQVFFTSATPTWLRELKSKIRTDAKQIPTVLVDFRLTQNAASGVCKSHDKEEEFSLLILKQFSEYSAVSITLVGMPIQGRKLDS